MAWVEALPGGGIDSTEGFEEVEEEEEEIEEGERKGGGLVIETVASAPTGQDGAEEGGEIEEEEETETSALEGTLTRVTPNSSRLNPFIFSPTPSTTPAHDKLATILL